MSEPSTLHPDDIPTHGVWEPLDLGPELLAGYRDVTGWAEQSVPAGLSILVGRLAITRGGRPLPPGGVLLGIELRSISPPPEDGRFEFRTTSEVTPHRSGRPLLRAATRLRVPGGREVAEVELAIRWPDE